MGSMSIWHWLLVLLIVVLLFGTKKLGNIGSDLGKAIRGFKKGLNEDDEEDPDAKDPGKPEPQLRADDAPAEKTKAERQAHTRDD